MHISYVSVGATGHVLASLPLVTELVKRGVRVTYFTSENFRAMVEATGAAFSPVNTVLTDQGKADKDVAKDMDAELPLRFLSEGAAAVEQILGGHASGYASCRYQRYAGHLGPPGRQRTEAPFDPDVHQLCLQRFLRCIGQPA